jgi:hypothetical protein
MGYSPDQIELLIAFAAVMIFAGIWFPLIDHLTKLSEPWVRVSLGGLPVLLFIAVLAHFWRKFHE